jgi:2-C-methyl-D-erythritol 2,4-cyclodiphosphate synthase
MRIGQGFDVHPFTEDPDRVLVLGGVRIPGSRGLAGHSDADAVAHAVADAVLGAAGLGDLGGNYRIRNQPGQAPTAKRFLAT